MTLNNESLISKKDSRRIRVCLAGSGGGHLRQLMQLAPITEAYDFYFLTEKTPLGLSVQAEHPTCFVHHCALGQRKMRGQHFLWSAAANLVSSVYYFLRHRPDVIISTGAGAAYFTLVLAKLFNKKSIYIESIARVSSVSQFGKKSMGLVDLYLVQWPSLVESIPNAIYCNPFTEVRQSNRRKKDKICVTVGTVLPFDRMIEYVDSLKRENLITETVFAQVGASQVNCSGMEVHQSIDQDELVKHLDESKIAIVHGGSGSILGALKAGCIVIAVPREECRSEHYDDHQFELVGELRDQGLILEARTKEELAEALEIARAMEPKVIEINPDSYSQHIEDFFNDENSAFDAEEQSTAPLLEQ